eukprot:jgi/Chlat1/6288/Chrsp44S05874
MPPQAHPRSTPSSRLSPPPQAAPLPGNGSNGSAFTAQPERNLANAAMSATASTRLRLLGSAVRSRVAVRAMASAGAAAQQQEEQQVRHEADRRRFALGSGEELAVLEYSFLPQQKVMDMAHTYVPPSMRGRRVADRLAAAAFEYCGDQGFRVIPSCSYIGDTYLRRHPELQSLVAQ